MVLFKLAACVTLIFLLKFLEGAVGSKINLLLERIGWNLQRLLFLTSKTLNGLWLGSHVLLPRVRTSPRMDFNLIVLADGLR